MSRLDHFNQTERQQLRQAGERLIGGQAGSRADFTRAWADCDLAEDAPLLKVELERAGVAAWLPRQRETCI